MSKTKRLIKLLSNIKQDLKFLKFWDMPLIIHACVRMKHGNFQKSNYGDDLNYYLLKELTKKDIVFSPYSLICSIFKPKRYYVIGSIISNSVNKRAIIWGAGSQLDSMPKVPAKVLAVRGPLTRNLLLEQGIECPEIYGDPALLLPYSYTPKCQKKFKLGLIPHVLDYENPIIKQISMNSEVLLINLASYEDWKDIINQINMCEYIVSSSLHGLIISDAYNIPNLWVKVGYELGGEKYFKYRDYFESVKRVYKDPVKLDKQITIEELINFASEWSPIQYDPQKLLNSSPFILKINKNVK